MRKLMWIVLAGFILLGTAPAVLADGPDYRQARQEVLLADLQTTVGLSGDQMALLDTLSLAHRENLVGLVGEIGEIHAEIRELRDNFEANHLLIFHLEFELMVRELERAALVREFAGAVDGVLLEDQKEYRPLVMTILEEVYRFRPPRPGEQNLKSHDHAGRG